jgi:hypothetical protein
MNWKEAFQLLFSEDQIDPKKCLRLNGMIGGICIIASISVLILLKIQPPKFTIPLELVYVQLILGVLLGSGWIFKASNHPIIRFLLVLHGAIYLVFVAVYTWFFFCIIYLGGGYKGFQRIGHAPGILALLTAYGTRLCLDFIPVRVKRKSVILISLIIGAICDLIILYAFIRLFPIIMASSQD